MVISWSPETQQDTICIIITRNAISILRHLATAYYHLISAAENASKIKCPALRFGCSDWFWNIAPIELSFHHGEISSILGLARHIKLSDPGGLVVEIRRPAVPVY
jgi:hypothetical protein